MSLQNIYATIKDSLDPAKPSPWITLTENWEPYVIDLTGENLSSVVGAFMWETDREHSGERDVEFDLDEIYFTTRVE